MISLNEFNGIYDQHVDAVFRVTLCVVGSREIAEEITSEVFLALFQSAEAVSRNQIPAWLFAAARRRSADYWLRWYLEQLWADDSPDFEIPDPSPDHPQIPFDDLLARCPALKPVHRACLILRFVQRMSRKEISAYTGFSDPQVKGHLQYGLKLLRDSLVAPRNHLPVQELSDA